MTKHDYSGALIWHEQSVGDSEQLDKFDRKNYETIRHALKTMQELPGVIEKMKGPSTEFTFQYDQGYNAALDAVLEKFKQMEKKNG
jgi:hypothetical protein